MAHLPNEKLIWDDVPLPRRSHHTGLHGGSTQYCKGTHRGLDMEQNVFRMFMSGSMK